MSDKILIVEDSATDCLIIKKLLSNYNILTACNELEAMHQLEINDDIDLVILDFNMSNMDDWQVLDDIKKTERFKDLHMIILTSGAAFEESQEFYAGAIDYIKKPVNTETLLMKIEFHLEFIRMHKMYERKLHENKILLEAIIDQAPIGIALFYGDEPFDAMQNNVPIINKRMEKIA
jgi:CheY-like chemotaxis protein